ncbi:MAG: zinc ribbon domain-containing protein [Dehalococcoidales bacterium]|nr:zinc ribbon domain-containing protein [Dehalococcoidales bacterium]
MGGIEDIFEDLFEGFRRRRQGYGGHHGDAGYYPEPRARSSERQHCPRCGAEAAPNSAFCQECGERLPQAGTASVCSACGAQLKAGWKFCPGCGAPAR